MRPYVLVFLPAFIAGCSCDDHPSVSAPTGPQGGTNPTRQQVTNENPPPEIWVSLDKQTCTGDAGVAQVQPPIYVSPVINPVGGRSYAVLIWSFCNASRSDLPAQGQYKLLVSPHDLVEQQVQNDANCRAPRPDGNIGFPSECFPPVPTGDLSLTFQVPALPSCACHGEILFVNVPAGQDNVVANLPPTRRATMPAGDYNFTLSTPWDVHIQDLEVILK